MEFLRCPLPLNTVTPMLAKDGELEENSRLNLRG